MLLSRLYLMALNSYFKKGQEIELVGNTILCDVISNNCLHLITGFFRLNAPLSVLCSVV